MFRSRSSELSLRAAGKKQVSPGHVSQDTNQINFDHMSTSNSSWHEQLSGANDDFSVEERYLVSPAEKEALVMVVQAADGQREAFRRFQEKELRGKSVDVVVAGVLLCEAIDRPTLRLLLEHHLAVHESGRSLTESIRSFSEELLSQCLPSPIAEATSGAKAQGPSLEMLKSSWSRQAIHAASGLTRLATGELVSSMHLLQRFSRYDHLGGRATVTPYGREAMQAFGYLPNLLAEISLRHVLDWACQGEWETAVLAAENIVCDETSGPHWKVAAVSIAEYCAVMAGVTVGPLGRESELSESRSATSTLALLTAVFSSMIANKEPLVTLEGNDACLVAGGAEPLHAIRQSLGALMAEDEKPTSVGLGVEAESLLSGSPFEKSIGYSLRVLQMHVLMLRGRFEHALRVGRYLSEIEPRSSVSESRYKSFIDRDIAALALVVGGRS